MNRRLTATLPILVLAVGLAGCAAAEPVAPAWTFSPSSPAAASVAPSEALRARSVTVYRSPSCSCCHEYEAYLRLAGWTVETVDVDDTSAFKTDRGIPQAAWSCHTVVTAGYIVEGHVPLEAVEKLLTERPSIAGIALPGMPAGSPGMPGTKTAPFEVIAIGSDGSLAPFGSF